MSRALRTAVLACSLLAIAATPAAAHQGNPNFRSVVDAIVPAVPGLHIQVLGYDDELEITNRTGKPVVIYGYDKEPYARLLADGTVQENRRSPAVYLNEDRFGGTPVPASADAKAPPQWHTLDRTSRFQWHDHRMHWMARTRPPAVHDVHRKTKIFDYRIDLRVGARPAHIAGTLFWIGSPAGSSPFVVISLIVLAVLAIGFVVVVRRRRRGDGDGDGDGPDGAAPPAAGDPTPTREAW